jgi:hypothetical protein
MVSAIDPSICPVCGSPNTCGVQAGKSDCWCFSADIPAEALERVPTDAKDLACLCPRCAQALASTRAVSTSPADP